MIKVIAFDYAGVIEISERDIIKEITEYLHVPEEKWRTVYYSLNHLCNTGAKTWNEVAVLTSLHVGATDDQLQGIEQLLEANRESKKINYELIEFIRKLRLHYKIALVSNYPAYLREKLGRQNILDIFDEIIISGEVGFQKPEPEIFKLLCERMNIKPYELIFIDDSQKSLEGASAIGYLPIHYVSNEKFEAALADILVN